MRFNLPSFITLPISHLIGKTMKQKNARSTKGLMSIAISQGSIGQNYQVEVKNAV